MRKSISIWPLFALIALFAGTFSACSNQINPNSNANSGATASAEPTPDKPAIEAQLKALEYDWPRIIKERDGAAVRNLEADDVVLIDPSGNDGTKEGDIKDIESGDQANDPEEISDVTVNVLNNDSAVVRSRTKVKGDSYKIGDPKCPQVIHEFRTLDTFFRRNGQWQIVASATVPVENQAAADNSSPAANSTATPKEGSAIKSPSPSRGASPATKRSPE